MSKTTTLAGAALALCATLNVNAAVMLDFVGTSDIAPGFEVDGSPVPVGTPFTVWVTIDDADAAAGLYPILAVEGALGGIPFTTVGPWDNEPLHAVQEVGAVRLSNIEFAPGGTENSMDEDFFVDLRIVGPGVLATDPGTWFDTGPLAAGDFFGKSDIRLASEETEVEISAFEIYDGTLRLVSSVASPVPEPAPMALLGLALVASGLSRLRR